MNKEQLGLPRGFGKVRFELTVTETLRERLAAKTGTDPNIEVTKFAANALETIAEVGSYWSPEDTGQLNILNREIFQINGVVNSFVGSSRHWLKVGEKHFIQALDSYYKVLHISNEAFTIYEDVIARLHAVIASYESSLEKYKSILENYLHACEVNKDTINYLRDELVKAKIENIRLKAIQAEHCIGCPASYL